MPASQSPVHGIPDSDSNTSDTGIDSESIDDFHERWFSSLREEIKDMFRKDHSEGSLQHQEQHSENQSHGRQSTRHMDSRRRGVQSIPTAKQSRGPQLRRIRRDASMEDQGINKGSMGDQGLSQDDDNFEGESSRFQLPFEGRILEQDSVDWEGETFQKAKCYFVDNDNLDDKRRDDISVFAIKHFLKGDNTDCESALCAELVKFSKTVLETVQNTSDTVSLAPQNIGEYVVRAGHDKEISLVDLGEELEDEKLPDFEYFEKEKGASSRRFGLANTSKPVRNGRRNSRLRAIDFYAGAGLASRGFEKVDFDIVAGIEKDSDAAESYSKIHGATLLDVTSMECLETFIRNPCKAIFHNTTEEFLTEYQKNKEFKRAIGPIDLVIFCPPCQGFSAENRNRQGNVEQNNRESLRMVDAAKLIRPKCIVFENVCGMWQKDFIEKYVKKIVYGLLHLQFNVQMGKLCAADFGDAQKRPRVIMIASLSQIGLPVFPRPTHGHSLIPFVTVGDALRCEEGKHPEDENPIYDDGEQRDANLPAETVKASKSAPHYSENRRFTLVENAILMGEGAWFVEKLVGNRAAKQRQIGNGVPRELAKAIGVALMGVLRFFWVEVDVVDPQFGDNEPMQWYWVGDNHTLPRPDVERQTSSEKEPEEIKSEFKVEIKPEKFKSESDTKPHIKPDTAQSAL